MSPYRYLFKNTGAVSGWCFVSVTIKESRSNKNHDELINYTGVVSKSAIIFGHSERVIGSRMLFFFFSYTEC